MIDKSVRKKREELRRISSLLRIMALDERNDKSRNEEIRYTQNEVYKHWLFFDKVIKSVERLNYETNR